MARYDREFLVQYLQDICALYLADRKLGQLIYQEEDRIRTYKEVREVYKPEKPEYEDASMGCIGTIAVLWTICSSVLFFISFSTAPFWGKCLLFIGVLVGLYYSYVSWCYSSAVQSENQKKTAQYDAEMQDYIRKVRVAEEDRKKRLALIPDIQSKISEMNKERQEAKQLINLAYSANVIPGHYRNIYVAVFLYDWFSTSGADDLDMALNMFVLEEIKAKLDRIIEQQADMILHQRMMMAYHEKTLANQQKSMDLQKYHNDIMQRKIDRIQATEDERLRYAKMAESNTAATAYFAWANYLK